MRPVPSGAAVRAAARRRCYCWAVMLLVFVGIIYWVLLPE